MLMHIKVDTALQSRFPIPANAAFFHYSITDAQLRDLRVCQPPHHGFCIPTQISRSPYSCTCFFVPLAPGFSFSLVLMI